MFFSCMRWPLESHIWELSFQVFWTFFVFLTFPYFFKDLNLFILVQVGRSKRSLCTEHRPPRRAWSHDLAIMIWGKPRVRCLTNWGTQVPHLTFSYRRIKILYIFWVSPPQIQELTTSSPTVRLAFLHR